MCLSPNITLANLVDTLPTPEVLAMARIPLVEPENASPEVRAQYQQMQDLGFPLFNVFKVFGANAGILEGFIHIAKTLYGNPRLAPRYRELAYLRASQINLCHYWIPTHVMLGLSVGLTEQEMASMDAPGHCASFDDTDKLVLRYSEMLTRDNVVDDQLYGELAARFNKDELVELCVTVGLSALVNRVHATFRTDLDDSTQAAVGGMGVCMLPPRR